MEPKKPWIRRIPVEKTETRPASRPTFDFGGVGSNAGVRSMENKWQAAIRTHDVGALDKLLDPDFTGASATGKTASKAKILRELKADKNAYRSARASEMSVRTVRPGVVVVSGIATESGVKANGQKFTASRSFVDTWKLRDGIWKCVSSEVKKSPKS